MTVDRRAAWLRRLPCCRAAAIAVIMAGLAPVAGYAQEAWDTVVIGGSGLPPVEVNLDVIEDYGARLPRQRRLLIPGQTRLAGAVVVLRPPAGAVVVLRPPPGAARPAAPAPAPAPRVSPTATAAPSLPIPAPRVSPTAAPSPPTPVPRAAIVPPPPRAAIPPPAPPAPRAVAAPPPPAPPPPMAAPAPVFAPAPAPLPPPKTPPEVAAAPAAPAPAAPPPPVAPPPVVAPAPPVPAPVAPPAPAPAPQVAALPPATGTNIAGGPGLRVIFDGASASLSPEGERQLKALARQLANSDQRVQLKAYGGGSSESVSAARRLSLSRALTVRSFLIEQGTRSTRIDVRALGLARDGGPAERVDIVVLSR